MLKKSFELKRHPLHGSSKGIKSGLSGALIVLLLALLVSSAQAQQLDWVVRAGGSQSDQGVSIAVDEDGNSYLTGFFESSATFGHGASAISLTSIGHRDMFLAKYDNSGNLIWVKQAGGPSATLNGNDVTVDGSGNSYVTGSLQGAASFGEGGNAITLTGVGAADTFVAKYDSGGNLVWAKQTLNTHFFRFDDSLGIAVDEAENSYVTGFFWGSTTFGEGTHAITLTNINLATIFLAKYDGNGNLAWVKQAGGEFGDGGNGVAVDGAGNSFVAGQFVGPATFGEGANSIILNAVGVSIFVARYDTNGNLVWAKQVSGSPTRSGNGITLDGTGNSYVTGSFQGTATFGEGLNTVTLTSAGARDIFLAKYDGSGSLIWVKQAGGSSSDEAQDVANDGTNNSTVTGFFQGTATFGEGIDTVTLTSVGSSDIFVAKYDSGGNLIWVRQAGGSLPDQGNSIASTGNDLTYVTGFFQGMATFGSGASTITLTSAGISDIFAARYVDNSPPSVNAGGPYSVNEGASVIVTASGADPEEGVLTYAWDLDNDGTFETSGQSATFSAANLDGPSSVIVVAQVTDGGGLTATDQATVNVLNVAPTASFSAAPETLVVGQSAVLAFSNPFDPGAADTVAGFRYSYDCTNDDTFELQNSSSVSFVCLYPAAGIFTARGRITDKDGGVTEYTAVITVLTPQQGAAALIAQVQALIPGSLNGGQGNGLIAKLEAAIRQLDRGNVATAIHQLESFVNQVNAMISSGILSPEEGQPLIDAANEILAALDH
jgi:hypothetical protein